MARAKKHTSSKVKVHDRGWSKISRKDVSSTKHKSNVPKSSQFKRK